ncbi:MAG: hypothetical protein WD904_14510 [Dehalococcoidia bacterium]
MNDDKGEAHGGGDDGRESRWTWLKGRPKPKDLTSRRGITDDRWTWLGQETGPAPKQRRFGRSLAIAGLFVGATALFGGLVVLAINLGNDGDAQVVALHSPSPRPATATATATTMTTAKATATASPLATIPATRFELALWDAVGHRWQSRDLVIQGSGYQEGEAIPFLLRVDSARPGQTYNVKIRYDCPAGGVSGFDFLTDYNRDVDIGSAPEGSGPPGAVPDAAILIPDDPATTVDNTAGGGHLTVWGATFEESPDGPVPSTACVADKLIDVRIRPLAETVYLAWGGHFVPSAAGAAGQRTASAIQVAIDGLAQAPTKVSVIPPAAP